MYIVVSYGDNSSLKSIKTLGPYEVGYKTFFAKHTSQRVTVWYPVDRSDYTMNYKDENAVPW
jgi:hypothetical protein